jgi:hypothetical protein
MPTVAHPQTGNDGPNPPTDLRIASGSSDTLTLGWSASRAGSADGFELYKDGKSAGSTAEQEFTFTGLSCGIAYTLSVEAFDAAGRRSEPTSVIAASDTCPAPTPPEQTAVPQTSPATRPQAPQTAETPPPKEQVDVPVTEPLHESLPHPETQPGEISWAGAGAFVWHENDVAPESLGLQLHANGFSWVAVLIHDGVDVDPIEADWVRRFRESSGLPVGGWGVLRTQPEQEAELADRLLEDYSLDFYIANPEAEYKYSSDDGPSAERYGRSQRFVDSFRQFRPETPAAISSYCRADTQDIDWEAWNRAGFVFMPQAYVNDLGDAASPASCAEGAADFFPTHAVHPTVGVYPGQEGDPSPGRYAELLHEAGTVGFSVYLAETRMHVEEWRTFGEAIVELAIARRTGDEISNRDGFPTRTSQSNIS